MKYVLQYILDRPVLVVFVVAVTALGGLYSAMHMPVDLFPDIDVPVVNIITHYPAASSQDIELLISRPIEDEMRSIPAVSRVTSTSFQGISQVTVEFNWKTGVNNARQLVQARLSRITNALPSGASARLESIGTTLQEVAGYVIYGGADTVTLRTAVQYDLASRLRAVEGVSLIDVLGGDRRAFYVKIKPDKLIAAKLTVNDIVTALRRNNLINTAGYLDRSSREYLIRGDARLKSIDDIRSLPIIKNAGRSIPLGSVAEVSKGTKPKHYVVKGDGVPAVALVVHKQPGANTISVVHGVKAAMTELARLLPAGAKIKMYYDQSQIISEARGGILRGLLTGMFLAVVVLYFFLGRLRPTLIVAAAIPVSLAATLAVMGLFGLTLNVITMSALALAVGMVVDDSVIVAENISRRRQQGLDIKQAAVQGTLEIMAPDASGTLTTVAAFLPLILITGLAALFLKPFGLTVSTALLASLVISLTLVPAFFSRAATGYSRVKLPSARLVGALNKAIRAILRFSFGHKWLILLSALVLLSGSALLAFMSKVTLLPPVDEGAILIEYVMPPGTSLAESNRIGDILDSIALSEPDVSCIYRRTGSPETGYQIEGVNRGEIMLKLREKSRRRHSVTEIMDALRQSYSRVNGVVFLYHQPTQEKIDESFSGLPALFGVTIYGTDTDTLISLGNEVEDILARDPAIANVVNNTGIKSPGIDVKINHLKLAQYGVDVENILNTLQAAQLGVEATTIIRQKQEIAVLVKMNVKAAAEPEQIRRLDVITHGGEIVPLGELADIQIYHAASSITRFNGRREITLLADVTGNIPTIVSRLRKEFVSVKLPDGYSIEFTGQYKTLHKTLSEMLFVLCSALVLIFLIMFVQFRSWVQPLVILFTVPLSLVGAIIAIILTGHGFDVSVAMGAITLLGISVNNAIVLMDYFNRNRLGGMSVRQSLRSAVSTRLRPILMTALTTIFALIPIAVGTTAGSRIFQPFAITVIGGLVSATFATLILVPTLVTLIPNRLLPVDIRGANQ